MAITREPAMRYEVEEAGGGATTVRLHGRLTNESAQELREAVKPLIARGGRIAIDMGEVNYMDSSGLGALVGLKVSACRQEQCQLQLARVTPRIREMLAITYLTDFFAGQ